MLTWEPSQRTRGLLSGAHLRSASKIKKIRLAQGLVDPATNRKKSIGRGGGVRTLVIRTRGTRLSITTQQCLLVYVRY